MFIYCHTSHRQYNCHSNKDELKLFIATYCVVCLTLIKLLICVLVCVCVCSAPVHVVSGSAGCQEGRDHFRRNPFPWSAFRSQDYGYMKFKAFNKTHIHLQQISVDLNGQEIDAFWLIKTNATNF